MVPSKTIITEEVAYFRVNRRGIYLMRLFSGTPYTRKRFKTLKYSLGGTRGAREAN